MERRTFLLGTLGAAAALAGCVTNKEGATSTGGGTATSAGGAGGGKVDKVKAAWIYTSPINDGGWTTAMEEGRKTAVEKVGNKLESTYKENIAEGPECAQAIEDLIKDGNKIIFGCSFGYGQYLLAAAKKYPDVKFHHAAGAWHNPTPNYSTYFGANEEVKYLGGIAAGRLTKSKVLGYVSPFNIPSGIRFMNAFTLGAQSVDPSIKVKTVEIKSWFDPAKERQAAESLIDQGADVITSGGDSPAPGEAAKARRALWVGNDSDQSKNFPDVWITAPIYDWGPYYASQVQAYLDGAWKKEDYYGHLKDGFVKLAPFGNVVTPAIREEVEKKKAQLTDGSLVMFKGPLKDNKGAERVPAGKAMTADELQAIDWLVEGLS